MNNYCFFMKSERIIAIPKSNEQEIQKLIAAGYEQQFEEVEAPSTRKALERFADIRGEEVKNIYAFAGPDILLGIVGAIAMVFK
ncbi:MAG: hypothetical protein LBE52_04215 [Providencia sp.]|jgi:hypothetical protein|nr:hypothetical protein [Providencia sp.]